MKEQIEKHELAESIYMSGHGLDRKDCADIAEQLYHEGYRKQAWISVDERLPEEYGDYLVAVKAKKLWETEWEHGVSAACYVISEIPDVNGWHIEIEDGYQYEITHWMPLPEAPKGVAE